MSDTGIEIKIDLCDCWVAPTSRSVEHLAKCEATTPYFATLKALLSAGFCMLVMASGCCGNQCSAESVIIAATHVNAAGNRIEAKGTAVCIYSNERGSVLVTCKHEVVTDGQIDAVWVKHSGDWHECHHVLLHPTEDIAAFECGIRLHPDVITDDAESGSEVIVCGAGPKLQDTGERSSFRGTVTHVTLDEAACQVIVNDDGLAAIHGDSGGPARRSLDTGEYALCGIVYGYPGEYACKRRVDHRGHNAVTLYTPCSAFLPWIETQYCPNGNCPIQIRRQVVVPVGPLGFQRGYPRVIGIAEPVPQQYEPAPRQMQQESIVQPMPDQIRIAGPQGVPGPQGPRGEPGLSVTQQQVEAVVNAWLDSNRDALRGPAGEQGPPGRDGQSDDNTDLNARLTELEQRPFRMILASEGRIVDEETYEPGQPVVLDLRRLRRVSDGR